MPLGMYFLKMVRYLVEDRFGREDVEDGG